MNTIANGPAVADSSIATYQHIMRVQGLLTLWLIDLSRRIRDHDRSKLAEPEKSAFDAASRKLAGLTFGSPEYERSRADLGDALKHHYSVNRHHPEYFGAEGFGGMNALDLLEMICDWQAASERHIDGNINSSIRVNRKRYGFGDEIEKIIRNTLFDLGNLEAVEETGV